MKILKNAVAGTLESSDLFIQIEPDEKELTLEIDSVVANQYMDSIRAAVLETLKEFDVSTGKIFIKDMFTGTTLTFRTFTGGFRLGLGTGDLLGDLLLYLSV